MTSETSRAWQKMISGRRLDILNPSPQDIDLGDIAHGLARVGRWNGQTRGRHAFSVAQHSLAVEAILSFLYPDSAPKDRLIALLHDAPEYVIGDLITPFKAAIGVYYKEIESRLARAVHLRFCLPVLPEQDCLAKIKHADRISAYFEAIELMGFSKSQALMLFSHRQDIPERLPPAIMGLFIPWDCEYAGANFKAKYFEIAQLTKTAKKLPKIGAKV